MKHLIPILLLLFALPVQAQEFPLLARMNPYILGSVASVCGLYEAEEAYNAQTAMGKDNTNYYAGQYPFTVSATKQLCKVNVYAKTINGTISSYVYTIKVWITADGTLPTDPTCTSSTVTGITSTGWKTFNFSPSCTLTTGNSYAIVIESDTISGTNYLSIGASSTTPALTGIAYIWSNVKAPTSYVGYDHTFEFYTEQ